MPWASRLLPSQPPRLTEADLPPCSRLWKASGLRLNLPADRFRALSSGWSGGMMSISRLSSWLVIPLASPGRRPETKARTRLPEMISLGWDV